MEKDQRMVDIQQLSNDSISIDTAIQEGKKVLTGRSQHRHDSIRELAHSRFYHIQMVDSLIHRTVQVRENLHGCI